MGGHAESKTMNGEDPSPLQERHRFYDITLFDQQMEKRERARVIRDSEMGNHLQSDGHESITQSLAEALLDWFKKKQRNLHWRVTKNPYHIWLSEVMAQQTRIDTMLPYYEKFLEAFPGIESLAAAPLDRVLTLWAGLGYYRRAESLLKAAKIIMAEHDGQLPDSYEKLLRLPGIGEYMAGAIVSIAFNQKQAAVDGNVKRVIARLEGLMYPFQSPALSKAAKEWVLRVMPEEQASAFNQSLMELGALVCTPGKPLCLECPIASFCFAYQKGLSGALPVKSNKPSPQEEKQTVVLVIDEKDRVLMRNRSETLLNRMWEYVVVEGHHSLEEMHTILDSLGIQVNNMTAIQSSRHIFSHRIWKMEGFVCTWSSKNPPPGLIWVEVRELTRMALPAAFRIYTDWLATHVGKFEAVIPPPDQG